jgi:hypothetical protein
MPTRSAIRRVKYGRVPKDIHCPNYAKVDFIRVEHVLNGHKASKLYFCGACDYEWVTDASSEAQQH